ncbi:unnamed protein product [Brassica oleracea var. botrytis]
MMALETLMSLLCEIVWNCQDAKDVSLALVGSSLMVVSLAKTSLECMIVENFVFYVI